MRVNTDQAEIMATVLFATKELTIRNGVPSEIDVLEAVMEWKQKRRPPLERDEVSSTIRHLAILSWIEVKPVSSLSIPEEDFVFV